MSLVNFKRGNLANYKTATKDDDTLYFIQDQGALYLGSKLIEATTVAPKSYAMLAYNGTEKSGATIVEELPTASSSNVGNIYQLGDKYYQSTVVVYTITYIDETDNTVHTFDVGTPDNVGALIEEAINALDVANVTVASQSGNIVTLTKAIKEEDGKIAAVGGNDSTITLGDAAMKTVLSGSINTAVAAHALDNTETTINNLTTASQVSEYVEGKLSGIVGSMVYRGTISKSGNNLVVDGASTQPTTVEQGDVYVASANFELAEATALIATGKTIPAGKYEAGDMFIYNGNAWNVVSGENQVTNSQATITPGDSNFTTIATVDGTAITVKVAGLDAVVDEGTGNVVTDVTASGNTITISRGNVIESITGEATISGTGDYVAVTATTTNNATTLASEVKTQTLSSAASNANGLATAYDVKQNAAANCVLTSYTTVTGGTVAASDTINSAINKLETQLVWGSF